MATTATATATDQTNDADKSDGPILDVSNAAVKKMIKESKERGFVTYQELNKVLPPDEMTSEQIEDIMAALSEMGITVVENEESEEGEGEAESSGGELVTNEAKEVVAKGNLSDDDVGRTDDPVRMYLREMGSVELLSREGEIAIAKRIEIGREEMIGGICESPLTFRALLAWRDYIKDEKLLLRDIIDLDATYGSGPEADNDDDLPATQPVAEDEAEEEEEIVEEAASEEAEGEEESDEPEQAIGPRDSDDDDSGDITPEDCEGGGCVIKRGNPNLDPYTAWNYDLTLMWSMPGDGFPSVGRTLVDPATHQIDVRL